MDQVVELKLKDFQLEMSVDPATVGNRVSRSDKDKRHRSISRPVTFSQNLLRFSESKKMRLFQA
jgi:hypothetical protein